MDIHERQSSVARRVICWQQRPSATGLELARLILFPDRMGVDANLEIVKNEAVDRVTWATVHGLIT